MDNILASMEDSAVVVGMAVGNAGNELVDGGNAEFSDRQVDTLSDRTEITEHNNNFYTTMNLALFF